LGAAGLMDIGHYFPDTDEKFAGADSKKLLLEVKNLLDKEGYGIGNIDSTVIAEKPKLSPYISEMKASIADALELSPSQVGVKATTNEKLGAVGRREGMAALASVIIFKRK
jgi:2-C-methyl-D-erythritol 2,4-cyclodiphosphate synthase